ncbi:hypothetical protein SDJN02_03898, partial [Cucurbita argyrosperma subsp. argyrosperma]
PTFWAQRPILSTSVISNPRHSHTVSGIIQFQTSFFPRPIFPASQHCPSAGAEKEETQISQQFTGVVKSIHSCLRDKVRIRLRMLQLE